MAGPLSEPEPQTACRCTERFADAACPEHGVVAYLRTLLDQPAVAYDPEDPNRPGGAQ